MFGLPEGGHSESEEEEDPLPLDSELEELVDLLAPGFPFSDAFLFCPASDLFFLDLLSDEATKDSNARNVDGFSVSKSISISSGFESRSEGSRD